MIMIWREKNMLKIGFLISKIKRQIKEMERDKENMEIWNFIRIHIFSLNLAPTKCMGESLSNLMLKFRGSKK